ncbi:BA14K family protein (plasmid) [Rhizobium sp. 32-5/1]|uniref:BA14K family protein n=1 Tax=Rhizobium sp. 32-5/1 TaxID=3019602 RepID=UPI00240D47C8|nr:BA14K family protein [Rhizobium sp. 32-5/1]WEZ85389.1 BA14K family protein [Rhizobium sp. 32-5/1]
MTYPILPVLALTLSLTAIAGSLMAVPNHLPEPEVNELDNIDITSLWTSHPVSVDPSKQSFERLPALVVKLPESADLNPGLDNIVASSIEPSSQMVRSDLIDDGELSSVDLSSIYQADTQAAAWCANRYRSYRASDNTYQPYSGGRRQCEPPFSSSVHETATADVVQQTSDIAEIGYSGDSHAEWCLSRYRSYNPNDNTFRAFSGEIRSCVSPYI